MSNNQKQPPSGAPQQTRYAQASYPSRAASSQRDGYHMTTTPPGGFVTQQAPNQTAGQAGGMRSMTQTGAPSQASTPPQNELKPMQTQGQMQMTYVSQSTRPNQNYFRNPPGGGPPNQGTPRLPNHHRQVPASGQMYAHQMQMFSAPLGAAQAIYQIPMATGYGNAPPRAHQPSYFPPAYTTIIPSQFITSNYSAAATQQPQAQTVAAAPTAYYQTYSPGPIPIPGSGATRQPVPGGGPQQQGAQPQQPPATVLVAQQAMGQGRSKRPRTNAIPIINPNTGKEIEDDSSSASALSLPPSGESSARDTPQPPSTVNMKVVAEFAAQVAKVAHEGKNDVQPKEIEKEPVESPVPAPVPPVPSPVASPPPVSEPSSTAPEDKTILLDVVVQNSKLQPSTKEFVPETSRQPSVQKEESAVEEAIPLTTVPQEKETKQLKTDAVAEENTNTAKTKGGTQKAKDAKQTAAPPPPAVPGSQPSKPTSKANKMRELNMKGANKEGTDMDAFSTVAEPPKIDEKPAPEEEVVPPTKVVVPPTPKPKTKVDVMSIVKDSPVTVTVKPPAVQAAEAQDETDRAAVDKLVQVKNEANLLKSETDTKEKEKDKEKDKDKENKKDETVTMRYKKEQWSPLNLDGKKCYAREQMILLGSHHPRSKKKPENLPDLDVVLKDNGRSRTADARLFSMNRPSGEVLMPAFHKSQSQRGTVAKRNSQQGKAGGGSGQIVKMAGQGQGKPGTIHVSLSLREDVKLRETENAWKPAIFTAPEGKPANEEEAKTADLYRNVRGVLNKLTPEKFDKLVSQVRKLPIDTFARLQGVIDLVFDKAVDEPNFSVAYANMCKELASMQVQNESQSDSVPTFRKLLITRCQVEFERQNKDEEQRNEQLERIEKCTDPEKKKELQLQLEEEDRRVRVKSVGNIRFIGELFRQQMLTVKIMMRCISILLKNRDEDSLECLCKLLTTIGKDLETKNENLAPTFNIMKEIVDKKHGKVSSRVRFMLQDVIELRESKWVPRRQDLNPKTMEQIQREADTELMLNSGGPPQQSSPASRKDDRLGGQSNINDRKRRGGSGATDDGGWSTMPNRRASSATYTVEPAKLMNRPPPMEEITLGSKTQFGQWGRGSNIKTTTQNMYAPLENISDSMPRAYAPKGPSMERYNNKYDRDDPGSRAGSRSGSQHRQRPGPPQSPGMSRQQHHQHQRDNREREREAATVAAPVPTPVSAPTPVQVTPPTLNKEDFDRRVKSIIDEHLNDLSKFEETVTEIKTTVSANMMVEFVLQSYNSVLEDTSPARIKAGEFLAKLMQQDIVSAEAMLSALTEIMQLASELVIDIPKLWDYLAELMAPLVVKNCFPMDRLVRHCAVTLRDCDPTFVPRFLGPLMARVPSDSTAALDLTEFVPANELEKFRRDYPSIVGRVQTGPTPERIRDQLLQKIQAGDSLDNIKGWITANLPDRVNDPKFIRILVTAVCEYAVYSPSPEAPVKLDSNRFGQQNDLLQCYIDNAEEMELQCLFAIQQFVHRKEHPQQLIFNIFNQLWDSGVISIEAFLGWEKNKRPDEIEGHGVALMSLQSFFTSLKENIDEEESSENECSTSPNLN